MTSNFYLTDVLGGFKCFKGVFAADTLPQNIFRNRQNTMSFLIVNTENLSSPKMGHWVSISRYEEDKCIILEVFDSLALPISLLSENIRKMIMSSHFDVLKTNHQILQSMSSNFCGIYCITRFISLLQNATLTNFLKIFGKDKDENDGLAVRYIRTFKC